MSALGPGCVKTPAAILERGNCSVFECRTGWSQVFGQRKPKLPRKSRAAVETDSPRPLQLDVFTQPPPMAAVAGPPGGGAAATQGKYPIRTAGDPLPTHSPHTRPICVR